MLPSGKFRGEFLDVETGSDSFSIYSSNGSKIETKLVF